MLISLWVPDLTEIISLRYYSSLLLIWMILNNFNSFESFMSLYNRPILTIFIMLFISLMFPRNISNGMMLTRSTKNQDLRYLLAICFLSSMILKYLSNTALLKVTSISMKNMISILRLTHSQNPESI